MILCNLLKIHHLLDTARLAVHLLHVFMIHEHHEFSERN
jgi:hypothetical protein